jgi:hypothetical protein
MKTVGRASVLGAFIAAMLIWACGDSDTTGRPPPGPDCKLTPSQCVEAGPDVTVPTESGTDTSTGSDAPKDTSASDTQPPNDASSDAPEDSPADASDSG